MRPIDADALMKRIPNEEIVSRAAVTDAPTIDVAEVKRKTGRISYTHFPEELWGQSAICLSCGCKWQIAGEGEDNFCPNCGARMVNEDGQLCGPEIDPYERSEE